MAQVPLTPENPAGQPDPPERPRGLRGFVQWLLDPTLPGAGPAAPRPKPLAFLLIAAWLATQVVARYRYGVLAADHFVALHLCVGYAVALGVLAWLHPGLLRRVTARSWLVLTTGALCFLAFWYLGRSDSWWRWFADWGDPEHVLWPLLPFFYFAAGATFFRLVLPFALAARQLGMAPGDLGLRLSHPGHRTAPYRMWPLYLLLYLIVLPFVLQSADAVAFQQKYPMCRGIIQAGCIDTSHFVLYELAYLMVFVSGESFWRGFMTFGTEKDLGAYGIALMLVPYVVAHFGKPMPETLGALAAGTVLGWLALKHRSVWLGVALHYGVAVTMDLLAMRSQGIVLR